LLHENQDKAPGPETESERRSTDFFRAGALAAGTAAKEK
jgi:hypothetical protein